jgi:putative GTP pyrophosphokinase
MPRRLKKSTSSRKTRIVKTAEEWGNTYKERYAIYNEFTNKIRNLFLELLQQNNLEIAQIECRTKSIESFIEKIHREKGYHNPLEDVTDLVGIRIIAYYNEDVGKIGDLIKREFKIDFKNSVDKAGVLDPDRFGYLSVHYVVSLSSPRKELTEWKAFADFKAEVQVRTVLQHAWAAIDHKLRYKTAREVPRNLRRQLFRLSALLELADEEFSTLRRRTEEVEERYTADVKKGELDIEVDLKSLEVYFAKTKQLSKWAEIAQQAGCIPFEAVKSDIGIDTAITVVQLVGIKTLAELDAILKDATNWGKDVLVKICKLSHTAGFVPHAVPYDIITFLVLYAKRKSLTKENIEGLPYRPELKKAFGTLLENN